MSSPQLPVLPEQGRRVPINHVPHPVGMTPFQAAKLLGKVAKAVGKNPAKGIGTGKPGKTKGKVAKSTGKAIVGPAYSGGKK